ncbi:MAG: helix-turn-helix domain-containing protein, partial [Ensifer adhaerens]
MAKRETARDRILTAAEAIVVGKGVSSLTFDEVAEQTGLSKGGILYHFASKDALVRAMVERFVYR